MGFYDWDSMSAEEITDLYQRKVAVGENITVARVEVKEGAITHSHSHDNEEMILVLEGTWRIYLPIGAVKILANQKLNNPPGGGKSSQTLEGNHALRHFPPQR